MAADKDTVRLRHMLDHAREAVALVASCQEDDLRSNRLLELALTRLVEVIGEAAARVSPKTRSQHPEIAWPLITGMRHHLVHGYDRIAYEVLWETVQQDLPPLIAQLERALP